MLSLFSFLPCSLWRRSSGLWLLLILSVVLDPVVYIALLRLDRGVLFRTRGYRRQYCQQQDRTGYSGLPCMHAS